MKKGLIILTVLTAPFITTACDICGCGVGNSYIGILPDFHQHIFGIRYRQNSMLTHLGVGGSMTYLTTKEYYITLEVWGGWNMGKKFRVMAAVPYNVNERMNQGLTKRKSGIGDINVVAFYQLLNNKSTVGASKLLVQSLWIGGGIKMATGKYNPSDKSAANDNANLFQLGTGSYDFTINTMYDLRFQDVGLNVSSGYKITTANKYAYRYGNKFNINTQAYYKFRVKNILTIAPNTGVQYETAQADSDAGLKVNLSGGSIVLGTLGVETTFNKIAVGANFQTPFSQNLMNGIVKANDRWMVHVSVAL